MLYSWYDTRGYNSLTNSSPHVDPVIWPKEFELWFISPKNFTPLLYCPVFMLFCPMEPFDIIFLPQQWFLDCNSDIYTSFIESSPYSGCWHIFSRYWCDVWSNQPPLTQTGNPDEIVLCSCCNFWSTSPTFGLVLYRFLMSPNNIIKLSTLKEKTPSNQFFKKISGYTRRVCWKLHRLTKIL